MSTDHERTTDQLCADAAIAEKERELRKAAHEMVRHAKQADKDAKRLWEPNSYITADRIVSIMKAQDGCCYFYCGIDMVYGSGVNRHTNGDAVTLERVDSNLAHVADNCILACWSCNRAKGHNIPFDVMRLWAVPIKRKEAKWCNSCKTVKPVAQFSHDKSRIDGLDSRCRACNTIHCVLQRNARKRKLAELAAELEGMDEAQERAAEEAEAREGADEEALSSDANLNDIEHSQ